MDSLQINADDFSRRFSQRSKNLMWLLGAGCSASAGIPTAWDMIWDFKQLIFISQRKVSRSAVADLSNPAIRRQIQAYIDSSDFMPNAGAPDEYAALFEVAFPSEADRRTYIDSKVAGAKPSYGHVAIATLMQANRVRLVWTTNFDPLVADACARVYESTSSLSTVALDAPNLATQLIGDGRWPIEVKMHGDFRSRRLKNTADELRHQDSQVRQILIDTCIRYGLIIAGYSGRDESVMDSLEESLQHSGAFPAGLFWLYRGTDELLPRVVQFIEKARSKGVEAEMVQIASFDEVMHDLIRLMENIDTDALTKFAAKRRAWSPAPPPDGKRSWPVIRLNAIPVTHAPSVCRRVVCNIGGYSEVREAIGEAKTDIIFARTRAGVLAFGSDNDVRKTLETHEIVEFDLHTIEAKRLRFDSGERGMLREALIRAITRNLDLDSARKRGSNLLAPSDPDDAVWKPLRKIVGAINGEISDHPEIRWREGVSTRLDWADDRLWFLFDPCTVFDGITDENRRIASDFGRERTVKRYNQQLNDLIAFWADLLSAREEEMKAFGIGDGIDAVFRLSLKSAFSRRVTP